jgi:hypothetical protein
LDERHEYDPEPVMHIGRMERDDVDGDGIRKPEYIIGVL